MTDLAQLGVVVSTTGAADGATQLDRLAGSAAKAEGAAQRATPAFRGLGEAARASGSSVSSYLLRPNEQAAKSLGAAELSAKQYSQALRMLPAQITDIVTGLVSGQPAYMVAIQQGGQLRDSFNGVGNALKALGTIITPARLAIGGLLGATGLLIKGFYDGRREAFEFSRAITLTGNVSGTTAGQLRVYAQEIDAIIGTEAEAAAVLTKLVATGRVANAQLHDVALATLRLSKIGGLAVDDVVKQFASLAEKPTEAAVKLNGQYALLSLAQIRHIRELEEVGRTYEAATFAQEAFATAANQSMVHLEGEMGRMQRTMVRIKDGFGDFIDFWRFRPRTDEERLRELTKEIERLDKYFPEGSRHIGERMRRDDLAAERDALANQVNIRNGWIALTSSYQRQAQALGEQEVKQLQDRRQKLQQEAREEERVRAALFQATLASIRRNVAGEVAVLTAHEDELEAVYRANLLTTREYYERKIELLKASSAAQVTGLQEERKALAAQSLEGAEAIQRDERVKDIDFEILQILSQQTAQMRLQNIERKALADEAERYQVNARAAAEAELMSVRRQYDRTREAQWQGRREQQFMQGRNAIDDDFNERRRQLEAQNREGAFARNPERYEFERDLIEKAHSEQLALYEQHWESLKAGELNWTNGAKAALYDYLETASNVATSTRQAFASAFRGAEETIVQFITTGKGGFKDFAESIIKDLLRIQLQAQASQLLNFLIGSFTPLQEIQGAGTRIQPRASGGPVDAGKPYLVGEKGPELMIPRTSGLVVPNEKLRASGSERAINITVNPAPNTDSATIHAMLMRMVPAIRAAVQDDAYRGQGLWPRTA